MEKRSRQKTQNKLSTIMEKLTVHHQSPNSLLLRLRVYHISITYIFTFYKKII